MSNIYGPTGVWFLMGAALVFFMQAGFAMVEAGFTRAKNAGNIIMKNLMDFCIGTVVFVFLGGGLLLGQDALGGFLGLPTMGLFTDFDTYDWYSFVFNLVFCATAATIVSGAMAERTKFSAYCIYSAVISAVVYPIEAHWVWSGGWLTRLGATLFGEGSPEFVDFAGSCLIHMVGGISALIGTAILGPRLGKYSKNKDGSIKVNAIPGHSITLGALGCFILWFGWYGFNGAAASDGLQLSQIFGTTTISAGVATCVTMIFTWIKNGKPDVSMTLNGSLAGLESAYGGFAISEVQPAAIPSVPAAAADMESAEETSAEGKLTKIEILCNESKFEDLKNAMNAIGVTGMTVTKVLGCGIQKGQDRYYRGVKIESMDLKPKVQVEIVVAKVPVRRVIETAKQVLYTGNISDGKIFVYDVENAVKARTGEEGFDALQGNDQF